MATAGIVIIGDEILTGKFADENARFLIGELRALGVELRRISVIPDELSDIAATVADFSARFDHVFTSGGVGPTHDDVTIAAIAAGFGTEVHREPRLEAMVRAYWGSALADANIRLADVPRGATLIDVPGDAWPVLSFRNVLILPGVPALFRRKFLSVRDRYRADAVIAARVFVSIEEGQLAPMLDAVVAAYPDVRLGSYPRFEEREFRVIVTLEGKDAQRVRAAWSDLIDRVGAAVVRTEEPAAIASSG